MEEPEDNGTEQADPPKKKKKLKIEKVDEEPAIETPEMPVSGKKKKKKDAAE